MIVAAKLKNIIIIQVYARISDHEDDVTDNFYD